MGVKDLFKTLRGVKAPITSRRAIMARLRNSTAAVDATGLVHRLFFSSVKKALESDDPGVRERVCRGDTVGFLRDSFLGYLEDVHQAGCEPIMVFDGDQRPDLKEQEHKRRRSEKKKREKRGEEAWKKREQERRARAEKRRREDEAFEDEASRMAEMLKRSDRVDAPKPACLVPLPHGGGTGEDVPSIATTFVQIPEAASSPREAEALPLSPPVPHPSVHTGPASVHYRMVRDLCKELGIHVIKARGKIEGEALCSWLTRPQKDGHGQIADVVLSDDSDCLPFGASCLITNFRGAKPEMYEHDDVLDRLMMTESEFVDFCVMCGNDYSPNLPKIGPKRALDLIRFHKSLERVRERGARADGPHASMVAKIPPDKFDAWLERATQARGVFMDTHRPTFGTEHAFPHLGVLEERA